MDSNNKKVKAIRGRPSLTFVTKFFNYNPETDKSSCVLIIKHKNGQEKQCGQIFKVAWLRVDTQTILTIQIHVITKNHRIGISHTEHKIWQLKIRDVRQSDRGWYMCQINTDPMKTQVGYLDVVVPPDIIDYQTSHDVIVEEGQNATLTCSATGLPSPTITWRREKEKPIFFTNDQEFYSVEGQNLTLKYVNQHHMGAYLCIASNGVPPTVSKRVLLIVNFAPTVWTHYENIYATIGQKVILECITKSYPTSVNYWLRDKEFIQGGTYESLTLENVFKIVMRLTIRPVRSKEFGDYKCIASNVLGETEKTITVHRRSKNTLPHQKVSVVGNVNLVGYNGLPSSEISPRSHTLGYADYINILFSLKFYLTFFGIQLVLYFL